MQSAIHDIFVIGGGINGCGIARDAAGRGYSVYPRRDERSRERHLLRLDQADPWRPALSRTLRVPAGARSADGARGAVAHARRTSSGRCASCCRMPRACGRPGCCGSACSSTTISAGASCCRPTRTLDMRSDPAGKPLKPLFTRAFEYSDCWVNDARLVVLNARDAADRGAVDPHPRQGGQRAPRRRCWPIGVEDALDAARSKRCRARLLVNAAGPWVDHVLSGAVGQNDVHNVRLVQGSHIVVRRSSTIRAPISSRTPTAASSSPSPTRTISR